MQRLDARPELVLVDVGGVLAMNDMTAAAAGMGVDASAGQLLDAFASAQNEADDARDLDERNRYIWRRVYEIVTGRPASATAEAWIRYTETPEGNPWINLIPLDGAVDALARLVATGVRVALLSNAHDSLDANLARAGICQVGPGPSPSVEAIYASALVGFMKPDRRFFEFALDDLAVEPGSHVVMIGDSHHSDIAPAQHLGLGAVHVDRVNYCHDASHPHVRDFREAVDLIVEARTH